jgi:hypothetical protein
MRLSAIKLNFKIRPSLATSCLINALAAGVGKLRTTTRLINVQIESTIKSSNSAAQRHWSFVLEIKSEFNSEPKNLMARRHYCFDLRDAGTLQLI